MCCEGVFHLFVDWMELKAESVFVESGNSKIVRRSYYTIVVAYAAAIYL